MILQGNSIRIPLKDESVHAVVTSPPYWNLRDYNTPNQIGLEPTIAAYIAVMVQVFREVWRVLRPDGVCWVNLGDSYSGGKNGRSAADTKAVGNDDRTFRDKPFSVTELPAKNLCMIPARVAIALQDDGWIVRSDIIWSKNNPMPESATDRPGRSHEYIFMLVKSARYYYDAEAVRVAGKEWDGQAGTFNRTNGKNTKLEVPGQVHPSHRERDDRVPGGRNLRTVWTIPTESFSGAHYATFPRKLVEPMILAATSTRGICPECGKQWKRVIEKPDMSQRPTRNGNSKMETGDIHISNNWAGTPKSAGQKYQQWRNENPDKTTGWQPTCDCIKKRTPNFGMKGSELLELADEVAKELAPVGAIILDPFCGSGTVGQVARELGRRFIGIDLSAKYLTENALARSEKLTSFGTLKTLPMFADLKEAA